MTVADNKYNNKATKNCGTVFQQRGLGFIIRLVLTGKECFQRTSNSEYGETSLFPYVLLSGPVEVDFEG